MVVVLILANLSCGIFTKGPEKTVESFFKAVDKGKVDEAIGYLSYETIQSLGYDKWSVVLLDMSRQASQEGEGVKRIRRVVIRDGPCDGKVDVSLIGRGWPVPWPVGSL